MTHESRSISFPLESSCHLLCKCFSYNAALQSMTAAGWNQQQILANIHEGEELSDENFIVPACNLELEMMSILHKSWRIKKGVSAGVLQSLRFFGWRSYWVSLQDGVLSWYSKQ